MKKFLSISALVITVTSFAFIAIGSAKITSNCCNNSPVRPTTNRLFAYNYRNHLRRVQPCNNNEMAKFKFWYNFQQQKTKKYDRNSYAAWRSAHNALFPRDNNIHSTEENIVRHDDLKTVATTKEIEKPETNGWEQPIDGITFQAPSSVFKNEDGQYMDKQSDLVFEIQKSDSACTALGFQQCAINYAKHLRARRSLTATWNVSREFALRRTIINNKKVFVPYFRETFTVNDFGIERTYSIHTLQNPLTNEVVYIEGWSSVYDASRAKNLLNAVSRTIRFE